MHESIPLYFKSLFLATVFALLAELVLNLIPVLKKYHLPRAFLGGLFALLAGPQVFGQLIELNLITQEIQTSWNELALFFVNVVFACIFLGKKIPNFKNFFKVSNSSGFAGANACMGSILNGRFDNVIGFETLF